MGHPRPTKRSSKGSSTKAQKPAVVPDVAAIRKRLEVVIPAWFEVDQQLGEAVLDSDDGHPDEPRPSIEEALGAPCSAAEIAGLEKRLGRPLPASYRAYLSMYGKGPKAFGAPLGPAELRSKEIASAIRWKSDLFEEVASPFDAGAIPFVLDGDSRSMVLFVPPIGATGDMAVVSYELTTRMDRARDLEAYFQRRTKLARELVAQHAKRKQRGGIRS